MLCFSTTLLLAAASLLVKTVASTETVVTCDDASNVQRLSCDMGVISVQSALYGRQDRDTCSAGRPAQQLVNTRCSQRGTVNILKKRCDGRLDCEFTTSIVRTSDPCAGIFKYLETTFTCIPALYVVACESSYANLQCDDGQVISIIGAHYGRHDTITCFYKRPQQQIQNDRCIDTNNRANNIVATRCNGKKSCTIRASNSVFGDPCGGTYKYLELSYVCEFPV